MCFFRGELQKDVPRIKNQIKKKKIESDLYMKSLRMP